MLSATRIYLPHKWGARAMKQLLGGAIRMGWQGPSGCQLLIASKSPSPLETLASNVTKECRPVFALSLGRSPAVRKLTVQVMCPDGNILGYMKLPVTSIAAERVRHEAAILERLRAFPALRPYIPRLLYAGCYAADYVLFQSALLGEVGPATFSRVHQDFLEMLWAAYGSERSGPSVVEEVGERWRKAVVLLDSTWREIGGEALRRSAQDVSQRTLRCGLSHGDFAPWNTRVADGKLLLFDWESAKWDAPTSWDVFHFGLQTAVSLNRGVATSRSSDYNGTGPYYLYLLSSVIQFLEEDNPTAVEHRRRRLLSELKETVYIRSYDRSGHRETTHSSDREVSLRGVAGRSGASSIPRIVTTSWDDGDPRDLRIAELVRSRGLTGTFYIPIAGYLNQPTLTHVDLRALCREGLEIGAHSVSHMSLTQLSDQHLACEVKVCKEKLEQITGQEVAMFCYPNGRYSQRVIMEVSRAGYKGARTTRMLSIRTGFHPFEMPTTVQAYPHPKIGYLRDIGRARNIPGLWRFTTELSRYESWLNLGMRLFNEVLERGGVWHLYGHSWEIDELGIWPELEEMLDYVAHRDGVSYTTNGRLLSLAGRKGGGFGADALSDCEEGSRSRESGFGGRGRPTVS
jgi:peptidoglycan/xylan/chitin deacetylase (PgdA/CDA1 family)